MLFFLISYCFSFLFLFKSFMMKREWSLLLGPNRFWNNFSGFLVSLFQKGSLAISFYYQFLTLTKMPVLLKIKKMGHHHYHGSKLQETMTMEEEEEEDDDQFAVSLLDLPDLALESILERLSPSGLCRMATVCKSLRESCASDHLWKKHLEVKWGKVIGAAAFREWQWHMVSLRKRSRILDQENEKSLLRSVIGSSLWPFSWSKTKNFESKGQGKPTASSFTADSIMDLYLSLENGKFWFPAQVYNREDGHVGFLLSCYDAELSYDSKTDTFQARYFPFARHATERNINWDRLRAPPVDTPPASVLHVSDCLNDLKPDDHIEIQWRRSKVFPYGWWYGAVGHLEPCDGNANRCCCESNDIVVLEFNQYTPGSQWRRMIINRKDHREEEYKADGFYGGIRKLYNEKEISKWKQLWPRQQFE